MLLVGFVMPSSALRVTGSITRSHSTLRYGNIVMAANPGLSRRAAIQLAFATSVAAAAAVGSPAEAIVEAESPSAIRKTKKSPTLKKAQFVSEDGIKYLDVTVGTGSMPGEGDFVIVDWIAYLSDGKVFDNTMSEGRKSVVFRMGQRKVIPGLEVALSSMRQGGMRKAIVPPQLGYGSRGVCFPDEGCLVPPGETLEYDLYLRRVAVSPI
jgi:peptidylprolyl isomerase